MSADQSVYTIESKQARSVIVFAAGRGGNPMRHLPFLRSLAQQGNTVIAPHFEMLKSSAPEKAELVGRIEILRAAVDRYSIAGLPLAGVGHSIGTVALLALAGAEGQTLSGQRFASTETKPFARLALLAPPTGFFRAPNALESVNASIEIWVGEKDDITPPEQSLFLKSALVGRDVSVHIDEAAGHFSFMNELPPGVKDTHPDRAQFFDKVSREVAMFLRQ